MDEDEEVGGRVGVGGEDDGGDTTEIGALFQHKVGVWGLAASQDVEDSTFWEDCESVARGGVGAEPVEGGVEGSGIDRGGQECGIVDGISDIPALEQGGLETNGRARESEEKGCRNDGAYRGAGGTEGKEDSATKGGDGEDETVVSDGTVQDDFGDEGQGKG